MITILYALVFVIVEVLILKYLMCIRRYKEENWKLGATFVDDIDIKIPIWVLIPMFLFNLLPNFIYIVALLIFLIVILYMSIICTKSYKPESSLSVIIFKWNIGNFFNKTI